MRRLPMIARRRNAMGHDTLQIGLVLAAVALTAGVGGEASQQAAKDQKVTARGTFDVKVTPQPQDDSAGGPFSRLFMHKNFHGDLEGTSNGQMLGSGSPDQGSAGYVALEMVTGT